MSLNWREIDLILDELPLEGAFIQNIIQPDYSSLILELYPPPDARSATVPGRFQLYISLKPGRTRLHRIRSRISRQIKLQRFAQLLRSRIRGCRIVSARQIPGQRLVEFALQQGTEGAVRYSLWLRLWGNAANILFCDGSPGNEGAVIDAFYRRPARNEVSGGVFLPRQESYPEPDDRFQPGSSEGFADFNAAVEARYAEKENAETFEARKKDLLRRWRRYVSSLENRLKNLENAIEPADTGFSGKRIGDLILSNLHTISPGAEWVELEDYLSGELKEIRLDPALSPQQNAEAYYRRHQKQERRRTRALQEVEDQRGALLRGREILAALERAADLEDLEPIPAPPAGEKKQSEESSRQTGIPFFSGSWQILVGRSAQESDRILRTWARGNDYWVHARDYPGGHVFIRARKGKSVPLEVLLDAGNLAIYFSKGRQNGRGDCYYTQVKYLRRPKNGKTGTVLPTQEKNLAIVLDEQRIDRILGREA